MRILGLMLFMACLCSLIVIASVRLGARQDAQATDTRTFIFVRWMDVDGHGGNIQGAQVIARRMSDYEPWPFPATNTGGWTKRQIPDGLYLVTITADGYSPTLLRLTVPTKGKYPHRTFEAWMEPKK